MKDEMMIENIVKWLRAHARLTTHYVFTQVADRIEWLERELEEERRSREIAAAKAREFLERIEELESVLQEIATAAGDPSAYMISRKALEKIK